MQSFLEFFEENTKPEEILYHITRGEYKRSILKNGLIPNKKNNWEGEFNYYKSFQGVYVSSDLDYLLQNVPDWLGNYESLIIVVIRSRGYTQLFTDEDYITDSLSTLNQSQIEELINDLFTKEKTKFKEYLTINSKNFWNKLKDKFQINPIQKQRLKQIISNNRHILLFGHLEDKIPTDQVESFKRMFNIQGTTYDAFRNVIDSITKLKMKHYEKGDSRRIDKNIGFSGNPKIVSILETDLDEDGEVEGLKYIYNKLTPEEDEYIRDSVSDYFGLDL